MRASCVGIQCFHMAAVVHIYKKHKIMHFSLLSTCGKANRNCYMQKSEILSNCTKFSTILKWTKGGWGGGHALWRGLKVHNSLGLHVIWIQINARFNKSICLNAAKHALYSTSKWSKKVFTLNNPNIKDSHRISTKKFTINLKNASCTNKDGSKMKIRDYQIVRTQVKRFRNHLNLWCNWDPRSDQIQSKSNSGGQCP